MDDKIKVMESIVLRNGQKYGNVKYMIRDMVAIDDYRIDSANQQSTGQVLAKYLERKDTNTNEVNQTLSKVVSIVEKLDSRLDALEAK
jgi:hypothetical protein